MSRPDMPGSFSSISSQAQARRRVQQQEATRPTGLRPLPPLEGLERKSTRTLVTKHRNAVAPEEATTDLANLPSGIKEMLENQERMLAVMRETMRNHTVRAGPVQGATEYKNLSRNCQPAFSEFKQLVMKQTPQKILNV